MKQLENDMRRGENSVNSKLTTEQVLQIRKEIELRNSLREALKGLSNRDLALKYGVSKTVIGDIGLGITWKHV